MKKESFKNIIVIAMLAIIMILLVVIIIMMATKRNGETPSESSEPTTEITVPTTEPTEEPELTPTSEPTPTETPKPTAEPTTEPTPTAEPTAEPTEAPTPTEEPLPTATPTEEPIAEPKLKTKEQAQEYGCQIYVEFIQPLCSEGWWYLDDMETAEVENGVYDITYYLLREGNGMLLTITVDGEEFGMPKISAIGKYTLAYISDTQYYFADEVYRLYDVELKDIDFIS